MLNGPFNLSYDDLEARVPGHICGYFALGYLDSREKFRVQHVGRDDSDMQLRLKTLIGSSLKFKFMATRTPKEAFEGECELFHRLRPPGNLIHPDRPRGSGWRCPVCSRQGSE